MVPIPGARLDAWLSIFGAKWLHLDITLHKEKVSRCMIRTPCKVILGWTHGLLIIQGDMWELSVKPRARVG